jgi:hypothetical protein
VGLDFCPTLFHKVIQVFIIHSSKLYHLSKHPFVPFFSPIQKWLNLERDAPRFTFAKRCTNPWTSTSLPITFDTPFFSLTQRMLFCELNNFQESGTQVSNAQKRAAHLLVTMTS